ncbi:MAG: cysteine desulfurase [Gammaproteobacteria bacterium]|nr:cysteine desulfurase [Gammaproteobacteria bacterium]
MSSTATEIAASEHSEAPDFGRLRADFPTLNQRVNGHPLCYLDNAATTQKPESVISAVANYYRKNNANVHRGVHTLSERATADYEGAREKLRQFIGAESTREIVFTRGTTEAINLVAQAYLRPLVSSGDEVLITGLEHHSNIVPWQMVCEQTGASLKVAALDENGEVRLDEFHRLLSDKTRFVAVSHVSNALGTVNPVGEMIEAAKTRGVPILLDGAQALPHMHVDVRDLDCDFYALSSHKMFGPTGIGALYGKASLLEAMPPYQGGGDMISMVSFEETRYNDLPYKFEAGTPNIAGAIGLGAAIDYLNAIGMTQILNHEKAMVAAALDGLSTIPGLRLIGRPRERAGAISFVIDGIHPHDIGTIVDADGVAIRTGHHCAMPVMQHFGLPATARASFAFYNNEADIERLLRALEHCRNVFA